MMGVMRYPAGHKEEVRGRIVQAAAAALRKAGLAGVSIPALMKEVGLTHGGFYAHFEDREALVAAAIEAAGEETATSVFGLESLDAALERYLSPEHVDHPERGCVIAALGTDAHAPAPTIRAAFARVARGLVQLVEGKLHAKGRSRAPSDEALRLASTMVGAVVLARLVDEPRLARRILSAARAAA